MSMPFIPGAQDQYPPLGDWVTIEGITSTTYLERGQRMVVQWTNRWEALHEYGYVRLVNESLIPDADARFPTVQAVLDMIAMGAQTLPGEKILDVWATATGVVVQVGTSVEFSRQFQVTWPAMDALVQAMQDLHDNTEVMTTQTDALFAASVADLRAELVQLNGIAAAAAQVALTAAETAGLSAYGVALQQGFVGTEAEWVASLAGAIGPEGPRGEKGEKGDEGPRGPMGTLEAHSHPDLEAQIAEKAPAVHTHTVEQLSDATTVGKAVMKASSAAAGRSAIGAGTSNLVIGTTASTAKAGNYQPTWANISDAPAYSKGTEGNYLVQRDASGHVNIPGGEAPADKAVRKDYMDAQLAGKVNGAGTLWTGTQAQYDALPNETKNAAGFVGVII